LLKPLGNRENTAIFHLPAFRSPPRSDRSAAAPAIPRTHPERIENQGDRGRRARERLHAL